MTQHGVFALLVTLRDAGVSKQAIADALQCGLDTDANDRIQAFALRVKAEAKRKASETLTYVFHPVLDSIPDTVDDVPRYFARSKTLRGE